MSFIRFDPEAGDGVDSANGDGDGVTRPCDGVGEDLLFDPVPEPKLEPLRRTENREVGSGVNERWSTSTIESTPFGSFEDVIGVGSTFTSTASRSEWSEM